MRPLLILAVINLVSGLIYGFMTIIVDETNALISYAFISLVNLGTCAAFAIYDKLEQIAEKYEEVKS
jgi:hypothetical protein